MSSYQYRVFNIEWKKADFGMPTEAHVWVPSWLCLADVAVRDHEWNGFFKDELEKKHGVRPKRFAFELATEQREDLS